MRLLRYSILLSCVIVLFPWLCAAEPIMVDKNLFAQDRRPPPPDSGAPSAQSNKRGVSHNALQLDGVIIQGDSKKALLRHKSQPSQAEKKKNQSPYVTVREGQRFGDYQVVKIEPKSISLEKDGQVFVISLFSEGKVLSPVPAPPPPPGPAVQAPEGMAAKTLPGRPPGPGDANAGVVPPAGGNPNVALPQPTAEPDSSPGVAQETNVNPPHPEEEAQDEDESTDEAGQ